MARLPTPGSDAGTWGEILNDFLSVTHQTDGRLKSDAVDAATINDGAITNAKISPTADIAQSKIANLSDDLAAKQPLNDNLSDIAGLTPSADDVLQYKAGTWTNRSPAQFKTDAGLNNVDNTSDVNKPVSSATQTALNTKVDTTSTVTADPSAPLLVHRRNFAVDSANQDIMQFYAGTGPTLTGWINEWGGYRGMPYFNWDAVVRMVGHASQTGDIIQYQNNARDINLWAIDKDGYTTMRDIKMAPVLVLGSGDPVPADTPAGTVIIRT